MNREEIDIFRNQRVASPEGQAVMEEMTEQQRQAIEEGCRHELAGENDRVCKDCGQIINDDAPFDASFQHAPHNCGDPECPGVINKARLEMLETEEYQEMRRLRGQICDALIAGNHWHGGSNEQLVSTIIHLCKQANENARKLELYDKFQAAIESFNEMDQKRNFSIPT